MYHFEKKTLKNLEIFERKKMGPFLKKSLGSLMSLVQGFFFLFFWKFFSFFRKDLEILKFFFEFFLKKYIHEQSTSNATWIFRIQRNIETWNKQTNFKLNHDVANQMWSEAKLGHLLLLIHLGCLSLGMLEPWLW